MADVIDAPNLLLCLECKHVQPWDRSEPEDGNRFWPCPKCSERRMQLRCGWPKDSGGPCLRAVQAQYDLAHDPYRCHTSSHGPDAKPPPSAAKLEKLEKQLEEARAALPVPVPPMPAGQRVVRYIPQGYEKVYSAARIDHESQYLQTHELSLLAAHVDALGERIDTGESGAAWRKLQQIGVKIRALMAAIEEHTADYRKWQKAGNVKKAEASIEKAQKANSKALSMVRLELLPVVAAGVGKEASAREWRATMETRAKLQRIEQQRMELLSTHTLTEAMQNLVDAVARHASPEAVAAIKADLEAKRTGKPLPSNGNGEVVYAEG